MTVEDAVNSPDVFRAAERLSPAARIQNWFGRRGPTYGAIFVGGFVGGALRYLLDHTFPAPAGSFPWTIFLVNVTGAFALSLLLVLLLELLQVGPLVRPLLATGGLGAFTTFSTFVLAADRLGTSGHVGLAATYVLASVFAGLAAGSFGLVLGRAVITVHTGSGQE